MTQAHGLGRRGAGLTLRYQVNEISKGFTPQLQTGLFLSWKINGKVKNGLTVSTKENLNRRAELTGSPPTGRLRHRKLVPQAPGLKLACLPQPYSQSTPAVPLGHTPTFFDLEFPTAAGFSSPPYSIHDNSITTVAMAPPKKAPAAKENVSLGPLAGDGMSDFPFLKRCDHESD